MFTEKSKQALNDDIHISMNACKNQSDRTLPQAFFVMGISHPSKMKKTEKFAFTSIHISDDHNVVKRGGITCCRSSPNLTLPSLK